MDVLSLVARDKGIDMVMQIAPELPIVIGDEKRIRQVLLNLMVCIFIMSLRAIGFFCLGVLVLLELIVIFAQGNAVKFTSTGHVILRIDFTMDGPIPIVHPNELPVANTTDLTTHYVRYGIQ
jgi:hypothetical protein